jgi:PAS domain S-box-containing protein
VQPAEERPTGIVSLTPESTQLAEEVQRLRAELDARTRALERSEARFRDVIEHNADAIVVVDGDGLIRFANAMATRMFGGTRAELIGSSFGFPLVTEETTEVDLVSDEGPRAAEMRVVQSEWEGHIAYIASLRDVTERKRAEEADRDLIREQAARGAAETAAHRFRFLSESSAVLSSSLDCRTILGSLARVCVTGIADWAEVYFAEETGDVKRLEVAHCDAAKAGVIDELRDALIPPESNHPVLHVVKSRKPLLVDSVEADLLKTTITDSRHAEVVEQLGMVSLMMMPLVARDRALGAMALISSDTMRRFNEQDLALAEDLAAHAALAVDNALLYEEARKANQTKSDLLAVVSHDLRTPLNAIIGYAELLSMGIPEPVPDSARERLQRIRTSAKHLLYLLDDLLSFARLEAGHEEPHLQDVDVRNVIREMAAVIEPLAAGADLRFEMDLPAQPVMLRTDPDKLRQVLVNLGGNAVKYTEEGAIRVALRADGANRATIDVSDTGIGIAAEHLNQIFEPFWQVDSGQRGHDGGTGLGLSVVRELVRLLGGDVSVESAPGKGSTFSVRIRGQGDKTRGQESGTPDS